MRISDGSSDVCSSDLREVVALDPGHVQREAVVGRLKRSGADIGAACPLQRVPARARCKARPMLLCQLLQSRLELRRAGGAGMADRATTERRKAGTEDHTGIEQSGIGDHAFGQTRHRSRSEESRVGKEWVRKGGGRWAP